MAKRKDPKSRAQVVVPRTRRIPHPRTETRKRIKPGDIVAALSAFVKPIAAVLAIALIIAGYNALASSNAFQLRRVIIADVAGPLRDDVEQTVRRMVGETGMLEVDLASVRQRLEAIPRVRSATVARMLPDGIYIRIAERRPVVLVRREAGARAGKLVWLDDDAVEMGEFPDIRGEAGSPQDVPPIVKGFAEGLRSQALVAEDRERVALYKQIQRDFSQGPDPLWNLIDQIDLTFTKDVNLHLAHPPVMIHVGSIDFRPRFERALQVLHSLQQGDSELPSKYRVQDVDRLIQNASNISFIDAARSERIVVNFATPGAKRAVKQEQKKK
jgi:cell division septal protein FtsQ